MTLATPPKLSSRSNEEALQAGLEGLSAIVGAINAEDEQSPVEQADICSILAHMGDCPFAGSAPLWEGESAPLFDRAVKFAREALSLMVDKEMGQALEAMAQSGWLMGLLAQDHALDIANAAQEMAAQGPASREALKRWALLGAPLFAVNGFVAQPLAAAIKVGDADLCELLFSALLAQLPSGPEQSAVLAEVSRGFNLKGENDLFRSLLMSAPDVWAQANASPARRGATPFIWALGSRDDALLAALAQANPQACLRGCLDREGSPWMAPLRAALRPMEAFETLLSLGADPLATFASGGALSAAASLSPEQGAPLARLLISLGANPRAANAQGLTPIGAAMASWSAERIRETLGALPQDLIDTREIINGQSELSLLHPLYYGRSGDYWHGGSPEAREMAQLSARDNDARALDLLAFADQAPGGLPLEFLERAMSEAGANGLERSFEWAAKTALARGGSMRPDLFLWSIRGGPWNEDRELAILRCARIGAQLGLDLNAPISTSHFNNEPLLWRLVAAIGSDDSSSTNYIGAWIQRGRRLVELGADPSAPGPDGLPMWKTDWWNALAKRSANAVMEWVALSESMALEAAASAGAPASRARSTL